MKERIVQFLESEKISPAEFADKIGVQRSSMSHILNGRNFPSAAFIQKMLQAYPLVDSRGLMIGEGKMNIDSKIIKSASEKPNPVPNVPGNIDISNGIILTKPNDQEPMDISELPSDQPLVDQNILIRTDTDGAKKLVVDQKEHQTSKTSGENINGEKQTTSSESFRTECLYDKEIEQVLFFYKDKTFSIYRPS